MCRRQTFNVDSSVELTSLNRSTRLFYSGFKGTHGHSLHRRQMSYGTLNVLPGCTGICRLSVRQYVSRLSIETLKILLFFRFDLFLITLVCKTKCTCISIGFRLICWLTSKYFTCFYIARLK